MVVGVAGAVPMMVVMAVVMIMGVVMAVIMIMIVLVIVSIFVIMMPVPVMNFKFVRISASACIAHNCIFFPVNKLSSHSLSGIEPGKAFNLS
jgi:hypothetical protein